MRLSNRNKCTTYNIVSSVIIFSEIFSIFIYFLDRYELNTFGNKALLFMLISNGLFAMVKKMRLFALVYKTKYED